MEAARPLRADAERNRRRLIDAAAEAFAERGLDVSVAEIAKRAGVGQGTAFRHFPTKERLVAEIVRDRLTGLAAFGRELLEDSRREDPLLDFMRSLIELQVQDRGLAEGVGSSVLADPAVREAHLELLRTIELLVARGQEAGNVRTDISAVDVIVLTKGVAAASDPLCVVKPRIWRRYLDLVRDALRPESARPLSGRPPTRAELERGLAEHH